ncbi:NUDIX domain-containing protein [Paenibacillus sp. sptzw28]|uniref:NUDIX domain-containing protein n=1 Tax=Paenibacillus sp. sptzw28 TaxID=715179 RepID=UPI001C6EA287|nr:NUDIX domain-containing protein [Paenibacillus sp. sptzw28]QYR23467.1 NUDIX domain-containing protein [Paenibacillus sp. sptzw28]
MATAFLINGNKILMMRKTGNRFYNSEFWTGLGGHIEPAELNSPMEACLREIFEESGIRDTEIKELKLKYILLRIKEDEIRQQFVYFGYTDKVDLLQSEEGDLFWIDKKELLSLHMSSIIKYMIKHDLNHPKLVGTLVGTMTVNKEQLPEIQWSELKDPIVF